MLQALFLDEISRELELSLLTLLPTRMKITSPLIAGCFLFNSLQSGRCQEAGETYISDAAGNKYYLQDRNQFVSRPFVVASN